MEWDWNNIIYLAASNLEAGVPMTAPNYVAPPKSDVNVIKDDPPYPRYVPPPQETKSRGDGFWRGW